MISANLLWNFGDFDGDGFTDGVDFIQWNQNKFSSSDSVAVPEPRAARWLVLVAVAVAVGTRFGPV